eukprot:Hpha_TRINITY_DN26424_c0_g1::TRINITY_DN26424_c0_g1_i1::g.34073::m.34073
MQGHQDQRIRVAIRKGEFSYAERAQFESFFKVFERDVVKADTTTQDYIPFDVMVEPRERDPRLTHSVLLAFVYGAPVVTTDWVRDSMAQREVKGFDDGGIWEYTRNSRWSALNQAYAMANPPRPFEARRVHVAHGTDAPVSLLELLVRSGGGECVPCPAQADVAVMSMRQPIEVPRGVLKVLERWVFDMITNGFGPPLDDTRYCVPEFTGEPHRPVVQVERGRVSIERISCLPAQERRLSPVPKAPRPPLAAHDPSPTFSRCSTTPSLPQRDRQSPPPLPERRRGSGERQGTGPAGNAAKEYDDVELFPPRPRPLNALSVPWSPGLPRPIGLEDDPNALSQSQTASQWRQRQPRGIAATSATVPRPATTHARKRKSPLLSSFQGAAPKRRSPPPAPVARQPPCETDEDEVGALRQRQARRRRAGPALLDPEPEPVPPQEPAEFPWPPSKRRRKVPEPQPSPADDSDEGASPSREGSLARTLRERAKKNAQFMEALGLTGQGLVTEAAAATGDSSKLASKKKQQKQKKRGR